MAGRVKQESGPANLEYSFALLISIILDRLANLRDIDRAVFNRLASCQFIQQNEDVLVTVPTMVGKSSISSAHGPQALPKRYTVVYYSIQNSSHDPDARSDNALFKKSAHIEKEKVLITYDVRLQNLPKRQRHLLIKIIEDRLKENLPSLHFGCR